MRSREVTKRPPSSRAWWVYLLRCADGTLYCGIACDVAARLAQHAAGKGAKYTRGRGPLVLLGKRRCAAKGDALRLEHAIKRLPKGEKLGALRCALRRPAKSKSR